MQGLNIFHNILSNNSKLKSSNCPVSFTSLVYAQKAINNIALLPIYKTLHCYINKVQHNQ